jgi:hypothetical protein
MLNPDTSVASPRCDVGDHDIVGEVYEARTGNWLIPGDMVCVMLACAEHAEAAAAHPERGGRSGWPARVPASAIAACREREGRPSAGPFGA